MQYSFSNLINRVHPQSPKGIIQSAEQWVIERQLLQSQMRQPQPAAWMKTVHPAEDRLNLLDYQFNVTPDEEFSSVRWTYSPASVLYYLQDARILGEEGAIISPENRLFADFTLPPHTSWSEHAAFRRRRIPPVRRLKGWYATITWPEAGAYFHWMIESLPRISLIEEYLEAIDGIFVPFPIKPFHRDSLRALGIRDEKLIPLDKQTHFQPQHLFVPRTFAMYNPPRWLHLWYQRRFLGESLARPVEDRRPRRLFISRSDAPARRLINEDAVMERLQAHGFERVRLSDHSFAQQAALFHEADVIVGPHGAGFANLVFAKRGTTIVEILPPNWMGPFFMTLAVSAGCVYRHVRGETVAGDLTSNAQTRDILVDPDHLLDVVEKVLLQIPSI